MALASVSPTTFDIRSLTYLAAVDDNLCCPICRSPLVDPETTKCRHTFCADCISGALENSDTCPVDRSPLSPGDVSAAPVMIANLVNDLEVRCPNSALGCLCTLSRALVKGHLKEACGFVTVDCPGCNESILRRDRRTEGCMHGEVECEHCTAMVRKLEMEVCLAPTFGVGRDAHKYQDHESICPGLSAPCQYCAVELPRSDINSHQLTCEEAIVACEAHTVGCPWTGRRRDAVSHAVSCAFVHLSPLLRDYASRISALELENKSLRKRLDILIPARRNSERNEHSTLDDQTIQILTEQEHIRSDLERLFAALTEMDIKQSMLTMHMSDNMRTREEVAMIGAAVNNLGSQLHGLQLLTLRRQSASPSSSATSPAPSRAGILRMHGKSCPSPPASRQLTVMR